MREKGERREKWTTEEETQEAFRTRNARHEHGEENCRAPTLMPWKAFLTEANLMPCSCVASCL